MKTHSDIQRLNQIDLIDCPAMDLREEIAKLDDESYELWSASAYNQESIIVLWLPDARRAGIAWGSDAQWTDADSVEDALGRFFGVENKEIVN